MPGATGLIMTNYLYNVAKRDGTAIGMPTSNVPLEPRLKLISPDGSNVKFDIARMSWIGTPLQEPQVTWVWHTAPAQERRRPQEQHHPDGRDHAARPTIRSCRSWSTRCSAPG